MNTELWTKIESFNLDYPVSEYGFSTRLSSENLWTKHFSQKAILEYKKFMYLAATSEVMISPSQIVDIVWHQHLIFTKSYSDFCSMLGKTIHHIPSTHNREELKTFQDAKANTRRCYNEVFGEQPEDIWHCDNMYESLHWRDSQFSIRAFVIVMIPAAIILLLPLYFLLKPLYIHIDNPYFLIGYIALAAASFIFLEIYNSSYFVTLVEKIKEHAFVYHLQPSEVIYLRSQSLVEAIHNTINRLIEDNKISVDNNRNLIVGNYEAATTPEELAVKELLQANGSMNYRILLKELTAKPVFYNVKDTMQNLLKHLSRSLQFRSVFYINFISLLFIFMLGLVRLCTGIAREKPVGFLMMILMVLASFICAFLVRLNTFFGSDTIPKLYKENILPASQDRNLFEWQYFLVGASVLTPAFMPLVADIQKTTTSSSDGSFHDSSCSSGCGGGGSCGGCGGD